MRFDRSRRLLSRVVAPMLGTVLLMQPATASAQADSEVLSNATVVQMVAGKLSKDLIVGKINSARPGFDLSADGIMSLVGYKVDQNIIKLMLQVADNARRSGTAPATLTGFDEVLTNEVVVRMVGAKVPKQIVLQKIQLTPSAFDVTASGMVSLNTSKVPEDIIKAMMLPPAQPVTAAPTRAAPKPEAKPEPKADAKADAKATKGKSAPPAKTPPPKKPPQ
jgi:hypothetical protein